MNLLWCSLFNWFCMAKTILSLKKAMITFVRAFLIWVEVWMLLLYHVYSGKRNKTYELFHVTHAHNIQSREVWKELSLPTFIIRVGKQIFFQILLSLWQTKKNATGFVNPLIIYKPSADRIRGYLLLELWGN